MPKKPFGILRRGKLRGTGVATSIGKCNSKKPDSGPVAEEPPGLERPDARSCFYTSSPGQNGVILPSVPEPSTVATGAELGVANSRWGCRSIVDRQAALAVGRLVAAQRDQRGGISIKALTLAPHVHAKKATFKVTSQTLKRATVLRKVVNQVDLLGKYPRLSEELALVLCYELLFGEGLKPHGPAERAVISSAAQLASALRDLEKISGRDKHEDAPLLRRRSVRVNTLTISIMEAIRQLRSQTGPDGEPTFRDVKQDTLLPDVLTLPPGSDLHDHHLIKAGSLVLQSKASCMPPHALRAQPGWFVLDACAAPGNKTAHIAGRASPLHAHHCKDVRQRAALMGNEGRILALDRDLKRSKRLETNLARLGCTCATARCLDFLKLDPTGSEAMHVDAILLDPSCSGSGTVHSRGDDLLLEHGTAAEQAERLRTRLLALSNFQETALRHALRFPKLKRLVYSTCSVHAEENEQVVRAVLKEARNAGFRLVDPFPEWKERGIGIVKGAEKLIRVDPIKEQTDGFFIAVFERSTA